MAGPFSVQHWGIPNLGPARRALFLFFGLYVAAFSGSRYSNGQKGGGATSGDPPFFVF